MLNKISNIEDKTWDFLDVEFLYTNIDHCDGLRALSHYLSDREGMLPPSDFIVFNTMYDTVYRQCKSTSMGASLAHE